MGSVELSLFVGVALFGLGLVCVRLGRNPVWDRPHSEFAPDWTWIGRLLIFASVVVPVLLYALKVWTGTE